MSGTDSTAAFFSMMNEGINSKNIGKWASRFTAILTMCAIGSDDTALKLLFSSNGNLTRATGMAVTSYTNLRETKAYWTKDKKVAHKTRDAVLKASVVALACATMGTSIAANLQVIISKIIDGVKPASPGLLAANAFITAAIALIQTVNHSLKAKKSRAKSKPYELALDRIEKITNLTSRLAKAEGDEDAVASISTEINRMTNQAASLLHYAEKAEVQVKYYGSSAKAQARKTELSVSAEGLALIGHETDVTPMKSDRLAESLLARQAREHMMHVKNAVSSGTLCGGALFLGSAALVAGGCPPLAFVLATTGISMVSTALAINMIDLTKGYGSTKFFGLKKTTSRKAFEAAFKHYTNELADTIIEQDGEESVSVNQCLKFIEDRQDMLNNFKSIQKADKDKVYALEKELKTAKKKHDLAMILPIGTEPMRSIEAIEADLKQAKRNLKNRKQLIKNEMIFARNKLLAFIEKHVIENVMYHDEPAKCAEMMTPKHRREEVSMFFVKHFEGGKFTPPVIKKAEKSEESARKRSGTPCSITSANSTPMSIQSTPSIGRQTPSPLVFMATVVEGSHESVEADDMSDGAGVGIDL